MDGVAASHSWFLLFTALIVKLRRILYVRLFYWGVLIPNRAVFSFFSWVGPIFLNSVVALCILPTRFI